MPKSKISDTFPDFFIAGAPKCGTTSLYDWLRTHPSLFMPVKEPSFFAQDIRPLPYKTLPEYLAFFKDRPTGTCLIGEASPKHLYSGTGLREIANLNPAARIIIIVRNPVDLVVSFHGQMLREGIEDQKDFEVAWRLATDRRSGISLPPNCKWPRMLDYPFWGSIGSRLHDLYSVFPEEQIKVFTLDELRASPRAVYVETLEFLGISDDGRVEFPTLNERAAIRYIALNHMLLTIRTRLLPFVNLLHKIAGGRGLGVLKFVNRFNLMPGHYQSVLNRNFKNHLIRFFDDEVKMLEKLTRHDLSSWRTLQ